MEPHTVSSAGIRSSSGVGLPPVVEADHVFKSYGPVSILRDVSMKISPGESRALVGRNGAGKSTLVGILTGMIAPTDGKVWFSGQAAPGPNDRAGWRECVSCVYQRWTVIPQMTVAENLFLNNYPRSRWGNVDWSRMRSEAASVLGEWGLNLSPDIEAWKLSVEQRQILEIARALAQGSRFIILDEPTAELERKEVSRLFDRINLLRDRGVTFCYISHHLEEIYEICDNVTVLRDGQVVADSPLSELPKAGLVQAMVGTAGAGLVQGARSERTFDAVSVQVGLQVSGLAVERDVLGVNFVVRPGECVGLAGLASSGKEQIAEVLAGLALPDDGTVLLNGKPLPLGNARQMRKAGVGYVPRDRHEQGILPQLSVAENITIPVNDSFGPAGWISSGRQSKAATKAISNLGIVTSSQHQPISELSGGNQQKGMMARALISNPKLLVLVSPTQGVDIASKAALFKVISAAQDRGMAVLVCADDLDELAICDRVLVIFRGALTKEFKAGWSEHEMVAAIEGL